MAIKAIDLFSGGGGVSCGLTRAGFKVKAAVELNHDAVCTYSAYPLLADVNVLERDICELSGRQILRAAGIRQDELYLLAGCPPCQNFSMQNPKNKKKPACERKKLLFEYLRIVKEIYPPFILMENVPGITAEFNEKILNEFIRKLENRRGRPEEKYIIKKAVLNAADYGVPQFRKRFVLHGIRKDIYLELQKCGLDFHLPIPTHDKNAAHDRLPWVTVQQAIGDLPAIQAGEAYVGNPNIHNHRCADLSEKNLRKMQYIRAHGGSRDCLPDSMTLACHKKQNDNGEKFGGHKDVYGIMDPNKPSPTMTGGCLFYTKGRYGHYAQDRAISIREAARFQTFPDDFIFSDSLATAALQIGNAVPVKLVEASASEFLQAIKAIKHNRRKKRNA